MNEKKELNLFYKLITMKNILHRIMSLYLFLRKINNQIPIHIHFYCLLNSQKLKF